MNLIKRLLLTLGIPENSRKQRVLVPELGEYDYSSYNAIL